MLIDGRRRQGLLGKASPLSLGISTQSGSGQSGHPSISSAFTSALHPSEANGERPLPRPPPRRFPLLNPRPSEASSIPASWPLPASTPRRVPAGDRILPFNSSASINGDPVMLSPAPGLTSLPRNAVALPPSPAGLPGGTSIPHWGPPSPPEAGQELTRLSRLPGKGRRETAVSLLSPRSGTPCRGRSLRASPTGREI